MPADREKLIQTLRSMKSEYENAIQNGNYTALIRSQKLINMLHEFVVDELGKMIDRNWIVTDKKGLWISQKERARHSGSTATR